jgi:transmembrane 9 superfamily protein 2/4
MTACRGGSAARLIAGSVLLLQHAAAFYVPGVAPTDFNHGDPIDVRAVKMTSSQTQLPFEYYSLDFCKAKDVVTYYSENLGQILRGERIVSTPYNVRMDTNTECSVLCANKVWNAETGKEVNYRIHHEYFVHLVSFFLSVIIYKLF